MSKISTQELDLQIQLSLVSKIREAARRYKAEPAESGSAALQSYVSALECLAEHIETKCRGLRLAQEALRAQRLRKSANPRVIPFPSDGASPLTAA
jgi:hypothetical protein